MIGILLLIIALFCYFRPQHRWFSYFLYLSFMLGYSGGFGLWTDRIIGVKNGDMAVVYTFVISMYLLLNNKYSFPRLSFIKQYKWLLGFLTMSVLFSYFHYGIGPYYILQGSRAYLLLFALPILCRVSAPDFDKLLKALLWVTIVTAVLYVLQIPAGRPLMPYGDGTADSYSFDSSTGLVRLYNYPTLGVFFLILSFVKPDFFGRWLAFCRLLFFMALMCTLGRTGIFSGIMTVALAMLFTGKASQAIKTMIIIGVMFLPFVDTISNRFENGGTDDDIETLLRGGAVTYQNSSDGGTMTYRIAWCLERGLYLAERPVGEQIFGLGLITDSYPGLRRMYRFSLGLLNTETGETTQMATPDISYGNLISHWGFGGTIVYMMFVLSMIWFLFKHRKDNPFMTVIAAQSITMLIGGFSGSGLSSPNGFMIYFLIMSTILTQNEDCFVEQNIAHDEGNTH